MVKIDISGIFGLITVFLYIDLVICLEYAQNKSILVVFTPSNGELTLPYFLTLFQNISYPKEKLSIFIRSGNNEDKTEDIFDTWLSNYGHQYNSIDKQFYKEDPETVEQMSEEALVLARNIKFDYIWYLDIGSFLTNVNVLEKLIEARKPIVAPLLNSVQTYYSNFWGAMTDTYSYARSDDYMPIVNGERKGCFKVPLLITGFLIDLRNENSKYLNFNTAVVPSYLKLSQTAESAKIPMYICNEESFGLIIPDVDGTEIRNMKYLNEIKEDFRYKKEVFSVLPELTQYLPHPEINNFDFDKVYLINLERQPIRKQIMLERLREVGLDATVFKGIDGRELNETYLRSISYKALEGYDEPYLTKGAIGSSLSHYYVWEEVIRNEYKKVLIFEDDSTFSSDFREKLSSMTKETKRIKLEWDLIYLCRDVTSPHKESPVRNSNHLLNIHHSYRTCGYILTQEGAKKLYQQEYISNMIPVDDYLVYKYIKPERRPLFKWKIPYSSWDLKAYAIHPLIIKHSYYLKDESDTQKNSPQHHEIFKNEAQPTNFLSEKDSCRVADVGQLSEYDPCN